MLKRETGGFSLLVDLVRSSWVLLSCLWSFIGFDNSRSESICWLCDDELEDDSGGFEVSGGLPFDESLCYSVQFS